jgi:hypothetical protein
MPYKDGKVDMAGYGRNEKLRKKVRRASVTPEQWRTLQEKRVAVASQAAKAAKPMATARNEKMRGLVNMKTKKKRGMR